MYIEPRFTGDTQYTSYSRVIIIQAIFERFTQGDLCPLDIKGTVVNRALLSLHGGSLEITLTYKQWYLLYVRSLM